MLKAIKENNDKHLWVGMNKNNPEHKWQLLDGSFDQDLVLDWLPGEPNNDQNAGENCVDVIATTSQMNDVDCSTYTSYAGMDRYWAHYYGLCEIAL